MEIPNYARRIQSAREIVGKSLEEMAALLDISFASYRDLESFDDEVLSCISLRQVEELCGALRISSLELLSEEQPFPEHPKHLTLREVSELIRIHIRVS